MTTISNLTTCILMAVVQSVFAQLPSTHENERFSINYPADWKLDQSGSMGSSFIIFSPQEGENDIFSENVNLVEQDLTGYNFDLDQYTDLSMDQLSQMLTNFELKMSNRIPSTPPRHKLIYHGQQGQYFLTFTQYFWVIGNNAYVLTFTTDRNQYDKYQKVGDQIMSSFKLK